VGYSRAGCVLVIAVVVCRSSLGAAIECTPIEGGSARLAASDAEARLDFIQQHLRLEARHARQWAWIWGSVYGSLAVAQLATLPARSSDTRANAYVGAGAAAIGALVIAVQPPKVIHDQVWLDARLRRFRSDPAVDRCALVAEAEQLLLRDARDEAFARGALVHAAAFAFNLGLGLTLALGFQQVDQGAIVAASGVAIAEIQIFTHPGRTPEALRRYQAGDLHPGPMQRDVRVMVLPALSRESAGLVLRVER
jgi:hypothetical protein